MTCRLPPARFVAAVVLRVVAAPPREGDRTANINRLDKSQGTNVGALRAHVAGRNNLAGTLSVEAKEWIQTPRAFWGMQVPLAWYVQERRFMHLQT